MPDMHSWIELDREALLANFRFFSELLGPQRVVPVLKANAYGHGLKEVYQILSETGFPGGVALNYLSELAQLRAFGFKGRVVIVGPLLSDELDLAFSLNAEITLGCPELLQAWTDMKDKPYAYLKFDTGMARQGFPPEDALALAEGLSQWKASLLGLSTHFANVEDVSDTRYPDLQLNRLKEAREVFLKAGFQVKTHAASSASSLLISDSHLDFCRVGISMYGLWPSSVTRMSWLTLHGKLAPLRPVLSWRTKVTRVRQLKRDEFVGYGYTFRAPGEMTLAVLSVGYFEGYSRVIGDHQAWVLIKGTRCRILGRICMNMMMVDVSHLSEVNPGDRATLLGQCETEEITADTMASWLGTINYEAVTSINPLLRRIVT